MLKKNQISLTRSVFHEAVLTLIVLPYLNFLTVSFSISISITLKKTNITIT